MGDEQILIFVRKMSLESSLGFNCRDIVYLTTLQRSEKIIRSGFTSFLRFVRLDR